ncbi:helix-turn-helix transcriptional regulator [Colwellia sp. RE-S-Sl-9]
MVQYNNITTPLIYLRIGEVTKLCGLPKSSFYEKVKLGLMPPPISLGERSVAWVNFEIEAVNRALLAGVSAQEIKALVMKLVEQRQQAA